MATLAQRPSLGASSTAHRLGIVIFPISQLSSATQINFKWAVVKLNPHLCLFIPMKFQPFIKKS